MQLVDEENDLPLGLFDLFQDGLQPVFKLAAILRTGEHRTEIERDQSLVLQSFRHVARNDSLRQAFDDRGLTDAGLADQHRIVLRAAREYLDRAADLVVAADHRIELALARELGQVLRVFFERLKIFFGVLIGDARAAAHLGDDLFEIVVA